MSNCLGILVKPLTDKLRKGKDPIASCLKFSGRCLSLPQKDKKSSSTKF